MKSTQSVCGTGTGLIWVFVSQIAASLQIKLSAQSLVDKLTILSTSGRKEQEKGVGVAKYVHNDLAGFFS